MKKCLSLGMAIGFAFGLFAQNDTYKSTFHVGAGLTGIGFLINLADNVDLDDATFDIETDDVTAASWSIMGNATTANKFS